MHFNVNVIEKRAALTHVDGELMPGCSAVIRELCVERSSIGFRWVVRDSIRHGGGIGDVGPWLASELAVMDTLPRQW